MAAAAHREEHVHGARQLSKNCKGGAALMICQPTNVPSSPVVPREEHVQEIQKRKGKCSARN